MDIEERIRKSMMLDEVRKNPEAAKRLGLYDYSTFEKKNSIRKRDIL